MGVGGLNLSIVKKSLYKLKSEVWLYPTESAAWHFVSVPKKKSEKIKKEFGAVARGWGSLPVSVTIGKTTWKTSIFPAKKSGEYILPLKAQVRQKEGIRNGSTITFVLNIDC